MSEYDAITAYYYAAYRPPLHRQLLGQVLRSRKGRGLDIGCGTGHSTRALADYCEHVIGIDPSAEMLALAGTNAGVRYEQHAGDTLPFADLQFDVVTFAGSLYYAKSARLLKEVIRVGKPGARVIVYDFYLPLDGFYRLLGEQEDLPPLDYDHTVDFSDIANSRLRETHRIQGQESVQMGWEAVACLMLSDRRILRRLLPRLGSKDISAALAELIGESVGERFSSVSIPTTTYLTAYEIVPEAG